MASLRDIKKRIRSAKNIGQVTKALEMVSAVKMRRAQEQAALSRPYTNILSDSLSLLGQAVTSFSHPLLAPNSSPKNILVIFAPDKGLAGSLLTNIWREVASFATKTPDLSVVVWGKRAAQIAVKCRLPIVADVTPSRTQPVDVQRSVLIRLLTQQYQRSEVGHVWLAYSQCKNTLVQIPVIKQFLPLSLPTNTHLDKLVTFEPTPADVLNFVLTHYLEMTLDQAIKDSLASEHSARMVAMKKARDNAASVVSDYQLLYNKTRQEKITNELSDLVGAQLIAPAA